MKQYLRILKYVRPHAGLFALSVVCMAVSSGLDALAYAMLAPFLNVLFQGQSDTLLPAQVLRTGDGYTGRLLHRLLSGYLDAGTPMEMLRQVVIALFFVYLLKNVFLYAKELTISMVEGRVTRDLRNDVYSHLIRLGFPFFQRTRAGQIISRVTGDVDTLRTLVTGNVSKLFSSIAEALATLVLLVGFSWKLTLVAVLTLPPMLGLWVRFRKRLRRGVLRVLDAVGEVASQIQETVSGVRLVKASGAEAWEETRFRRLTQRHYKALIRNERWRKFFPPATEMITAMGILAVIWYGSYLVLAERSLTASAFLSALVLAGKLMSPVK
ncbi:MAG TPA: ABC transporter transmembrane domain-containing protein, partial [Archangium sp.]